MKIAVLGWGSLICNKGCLKIKEEWHEDGPYLPVEFARISSGGRLTLVLLPGAEKVQVLWTYMAMDYLEEAIKNLAEREKTPNQNNIGFIDIINSCSRSKVIPDVVGTIEELAHKKEIKAVIWTDLSSNFKKKTNTEFTISNAIACLESLSYYKKRKAEEKN